MNKNKICYTGIGSVKKGNHTKKKFLKIMDKHHKKDCSVYIKSLKCKSCKKSKIMNNKIMNNKIMKKQTKSRLKNKTKKVSNNEINNWMKQLGMCNRCKNNKTKKCNLKNYMLFSGAEYGKC